jgi:hypothetical protein
MSSAPAFCTENAPFFQGFGFGTNVLIIMQKCALENFLVACLQKAAFRRILFNDEFRCALTPLAFTLTGSGGLDFHRRSSPR